MRVLSTAAAAAGVLAVTATAAQAATITVPRGDAAALVSAINIANATAEADTLQVSGTYVYVTANNFWYGPNALPPITSDITIRGTEETVIQNSATPRLRAFYVSGGRSGLSAGTLRLRDLEINGGRALGGAASFGGGGAGMGGAIFNQGTLDLNGVTMAGNAAGGGTAAAINSTSGGGMGEDARQSGGGGGFGGSVTASAGLGGTGNPGPAGGGGGGGGYAAGENGANGASPTGGVGGGNRNGMGGTDSAGIRGGNGSGAGGTAVVGSGPGGNGGRFGAGGELGTQPDSSTNRGGGGGGGVGGGGAGAGPGTGGGGGGFGGGGGWSNIVSGSGGFGGGGAGNDGRNSSTPGIGGFGGGDGAPRIANSIGVGGGGAGMGGAIFNDGGTVTGTDSTFSGNSVTGGNSTSVFIGGAANAGEGGDALGAAIFNLNGELTLTHVTIAGNTATAGTGATNGLASGSIATVAYDTAARTPRTTIRQSIVTSAGATATYLAAPTLLADGTTNAALYSQGISGPPAYANGTADPQLAPLGRYSGPTRTMAPNPGSPVINAATVQGLTTTDQRGFARDAAADLGAVETQASTISTVDKVVPFSAAAQDVALSATVTPARGASTPGTVDFNLGGLGTATAAINGGAAATNRVIGGGTAPGTYTFTAGTGPVPGFDGASTSGTLKVLNSPPVCHDVPLTTPFDTTQTVNPDCTGVGITAYTVVGNPSHGTITFVGLLPRYTPDTGFHGADELTLKATNEGGDSNVAKVTVKVLAARQVCKDISATTALNTAVTLDPDCTGVSPATVGVLSNGAHGTVTVVVGKLRYTPDAGFFGNDEFTYVTTNEGGASNAAKATVKVLEPAPICKDVSGRTPFETRIEVALDCDRAGGVKVGAAGHGTAMYAEGRLRYTPDAGFHGVDTFTYELTNEGGTSTPVTATITVDPPVPTCAALTATAGAGRPRTITLDCDSLAAATFAIVDAPAHGTLTALDAKAGTVVYTAADDYEGADAFTYRASNSGGDAAPARVEITVTKRPALTATPSPSITLGAGTLTSTAKVDPRLGADPAAAVEFKLYTTGDCTGEPVFASTVALAADHTATSGAFTPTAAGQYHWQARFVGDADNLSATGTCDPVTVTAVPATVRPAETTNVPVEKCGAPVVLLDVSPVGKRTRVTGIARLAFAGKPVTILRAGKPVGTATIGADGAYSAVVDGPAAGEQRPVMYQTTVEGQRSRAFRYDRYLRITKRAGRTISGKLALERLPKTVSLQRVNVCTGKATTTRAKVGPRGTFSFVMRGPDAGSAYVLYRVTAKLAGTGRTYSTQVAVTG